MKNIALLVPVCSRNKQYNNLFHTHIMNCIYPSFLKTKNEEYNYSFFIGFDDDDEFYKSHYDELKQIFKNVHILSECQHAPAFAWNKLAMIAYNSTDIKYDYFFQVGDDIILEISNWTEIFIEKLTLHNDIGVVGPCNLINYNGRMNDGSPYVIENSFVSRKHIDIFNYYFHPSIKNWYCDDWITQIYTPFFSEIQTNILCVNSVYNRYIIEGCNNINNLINESRKIISLYINKPIFICYNYLPLIATYVYDLDINEYLKADVKPLHNYPLLNNILLIKEGDKVFVKTDYLHYFFNTIFPKIQKKFYLITGVSDYEIDNTYLNYLNDDRIIKWIGVNISIQQHNKICKMLIGFQEVERNGGNQELLYKMYNIKKCFNEKIDKLLITSFNNTHLIRNNINNLFNNNSYIEIVEKLEFENYLQKINNYKFVLCPRGNGLDTHRFCEILLMGSVPLVEKNGLSDLYEKFPCIIVDSFNVINEELLKKYIFDIEKYKIFEYYLFVDKNNINIL